MPLLSVIVPAYNAESSLNKCLTSIMNQSYQDFEIILINDGSKDNTKQICDQLAQEYKKIRVLHKNNGGVSSARNLGLDYAKGDFITFIDSDDVIEKDFLEKLMVNSQYDLLISSFNSTTGNVFPLEDKSYDSKGIEQHINSLINHPFLLYCVWGKLFKNDIIQKQHIRFDNKLRLYEDTIFCMNYFSYCHSIKTISYRGYLYIGEWGGVNKYVLSLDEIEYRCMTERKIIDQLQSNYSNRIDSSSRCYCVRYLDDLYGKYTDKFCVQMYLKYHPDSTEDDFLKNIFLYPSYSKISELKNLYKNGYRDEANKTLHKLTRFITINYKKMHFTRLDEKILYLLITHKLERIAQIILYLYSKMAIMKKMTK